MQCHKWSVGPAPDSHPVTHSSNKHRSAPPEVADPSLGEFLCQLPPCLLSPHRSCQRDSCDKRALVQARGQFWSRHVLKMLVAAQGATFMGVYTPSPPPLPAPRPLRPQQLGPRLQMAPGDAVFLLGASHCRLVSSRGLLRPPHG